MLAIHSARKGAYLKAFVFALLTIAGTVAGLMVGAADSNQFSRPNAMKQNAIAGGVCGMIAGGIAAFLQGGGSSKKD